MDKWGLDFPDYSKEEFAGCVYECENETPSDLTACDVKRMTLLSDMSPGGQYFDNRRTVCPLSEEENHYDPAQRNDFLNFWVYPHADPALSALADFYGTATSSQLWDSLRVHWHDTIAEIMLKHHPEYPIYKLFCECGDYEAQHAFDSLFYAVNTFELAKEFGLLNPVNYPNWDYIPLKESHPDPFLFDEKCCPDEIKKIRDEFTKALTCYMVIPDLGKCIGVWYFLFDPDDIAHGGGGVSDHAVIDVFYTMQKTVIPAWASGYNCSEDDARWMIFRSIYTGLKEKYRQLILIECLEYKPPFELDQSDFFSDLYPDNVMGSMCEKYLKADTCQNMALTVGESWKGFQIRYRCEPYYGVNMENLDDMVASGTEVLLENCIEDCETFANGWMAELNDYLWTHCKEVFEEDSIKWKEIRTDLIYFCVNGCNESYEHRDFTFRQLIQEYGQEVLGRYCVVEPGAYTRIVYPRPENIPVDCGCNNYQFYLNAYGLTFWSEVEIIKDALALENIDMDIYIIDYWNRFCIWQRYDMLIDQNRDTALWDEYQFPEEFRCRPDSIDWLSECEKLALLQAESGNHIALQEALALSVAERQALYYTHCAKMNEKLTIEYTLFECGYTLYYYDQADNLIRTVPPNGVKPITNNTTLQQVRAVRDTITSYKGANLIRPQHTMVTYYRYTTQDLVTATRQPDHNGETEIYYDILFKPAISRDAKQYPSRYSYTAYDSLGRIRETGQLHTFGVTPEMVANPATLADLIHDKPKSEVTKTYYDKILVTNLGQTRLRNRIAAITYSDVYDPNPLNYQTATHYSYDIHGNVKQLIQNITGLSAFYRDYIYINYEYDLISGNMNQVHYQTGAVEAFSHRYRYDADNRLTHVYTYATDRKELEHNDAQYFYYPHGPLARMELGDKQVQGMDYAYTLQGWLKAINGYKLEKGFDMGSDGFSDTTHSIFGRDVYATMLQYNLNDYRPISGNSNFTLTSPDAVALYNGNISALSTVYTYRDPLLKAFRYDKLNRIRSMQTARLSGTKWDALSQSYATEYTYDLNGNLQTLSRRDEMANYLHNLTYSYTNNTNRLARVYAPELNDPPYRYDAIGNLIQDMGERFDVLWTAANKVKSVIGDRRDLTFSYSPLGQRQIKQTVTGGDTIKEYYIHDATGNVMAVYKQSLWPMSDTMLYITERSIYGSSRIGLLHSYFIPHDLLTDPTHLRLSRVMGERSYELTDHLGNVATTLSDRKIATALLAPNAGFVDYYTAEIENYTDYYPFGFPIKERAGVKLDYRYGFNGQEKDNEIYGYSAMLNFLFRMYDARLGRFWAIDPLSKQYPYNSTYAFAENSPIAFGELEGLERYFAASGVYLGQNGTSHQIRIMNAGAQYQQSKPVDYLTDNSVPFHSASESAQKAVATTMYNVLTNPFPLKEMNVNSKGGGTAASTSPDNHGKMTIYPNATNQGEYINDNYYNQLNVWAHESYHKTNNLSGDGFSEFKVNISQIEHWSFTKTTGIYKEYLAGVMNSNLQEQGVVLRNSSSTRRSDYDNLVNQYNKNVKILNDLIDKYNLESVGKNKEFNPKEYFGN
jgi:RHS repeat-associated protein